MLKKLLVALVAVIALIVILRLVLFHGPVRPPEPLPAELIVDSHVHVAGIGEGSGCFVSDAMRSSFKFRQYLAAFGVTLAELQEQGDALVMERLAQRVAASEHVGQAVVLALDGRVDDHGVLDKEKTEVYVPGEFVARETAKYPQLLYGASVHPRRVDALARLRQAKEQGAVLVKWLPAIQDIDPSDAAFTAYYQELAALGLPLLTHTGDERSFTYADDSLSDPNRLRLPLSLGVTVIAAHGATTGEHEGTPNRERLRVLLDEFPNLYADISALTQINRHGHLDDILESGVVDRLIYASDYPLTATLLVSPWYYPLHLDVETLREVSRIDNVFDRDVALKRALGLPAEVFARTADVLGVSPAVPTFAESDD